MKQRGANKEQQDRAYVDASVGERELWLPVDAASGPASSSMGYRVLASVHIHVDSSVGSVGNTYALMIQVRMRKRHRFFCHGRLQEVAVRTLYRISRKAMAPQSVKRGLLNGV